MHHPRPRPGSWTLLVALLALAGWQAPAGGTALGQHVDARVDASLAQARRDVERLVPIRQQREKPPTTQVKRPTPQPYHRDFPAVARRAAIAAGIRDPELFVRQIAAESAYEPCVRSSAGALGIAQIMPDTADSWNVDPHDPDEALAVAARQMARYERQLGTYRLALAAYNAGPNAVRRYGGVPPYPETRAYIALIGDKGRSLSSMKKVYSLPGGYDRTFQRRLRELAQDVRQRGGRLTVVDGWRPYKEQLRLWNEAKRTYGGFRGAKVWVAPPGCSNHNRGVAADLKGSLKLAHRLAPKHGLVFPMAREPWHVELRGLDTQSR